MDIQAVLRKRPFRVVVVATALIMVLPAYSGAQTVATESDIGRALRFRAELGLATDPEFVLALTRNSAAAWTYGIAMTHEEETEIRRRINVEAALGPLGEYVQTLPEYAGGYSDHAAGHVVDVALVGDPTKYEAQIRSLIPGGTPLRLRQVRYSLAELTAIEDRIISDRGALEKLGISVNAVIVDTRRNLVEVGVSALTDNAREVLERQYGSGVELFQGGAATLTHTGCYSRTHCYGPPLRGGISRGSCSLAFVVNQSSVRRILTAGHSPCGDFTGEATHDGFEFGTIRTRSWFGADTYETADAASIGNLTASQDDNLIYRNFAGQTQEITEAQSLASEPFSNFVCLSGMKKDAVRCGTVVSRNVSICFSGVGCLREQREATYELYFGDSGGAVYNGGKTAMGIQSSCIDRNGNLSCDEGDTADNALYSHIQNVFSDLGGSMSIYTGN